MTPAAALFFAAAAFNWLVAAALVFGGDAAFALLGMGPPADRLMFHLFVTFVALFGAGYFWVGRDPTRNHGLVGLGAAGKVAVFGVLLGHALARRIPVAPVALAGGDLAFAALFVRFLLLRASPLRSGSGGGGGAPPPAPRARRARCPRHRPRLRPGAPSSRRAGRCGTPAGRSRRSRT